MLAQCMMLYNYTTLILNLLASTMASIAVVQQLHNLLVWLTQEGQLSLAIPPWLGAMSTSESWDVNRHTTRSTSRVSVVWQCKLVSG